MLLAQGREYHAAACVATPTPCAPFLRGVCHILHGLQGVSRMEKSFLQNEGGYRDGLELQKGKKQGVVTQ